MTGPTFKTQFGRIFPPRQDWLAKALPEPVLGSTHALKYSLYYGPAGQRLVGYDNERGKGDHRHYGDREERYEFTTVEQLVADFENDVTNLRGGSR